MGAGFEALTGEAKIAVEWKAKQNLSMALANGNEMALANQTRFLESNKESLANNPQSVRLIIKEFKDNLSSLQDD